MASFIKKQILKHLTKFTKNLSSDKINLSTLRGEGELSNLELDCDALQNLMELPTWLKIESARCNRVHVKIPWTKLKTTPITIFLDVVELDMVACEEPRPPNGPSPIQASASSGDTSYGFTVKVLEGITVNINSITVDFKSPVFTANLQLSHLVLESTNPEWKKSDLKKTFIHDKNLDQVLTFKKLSWETVRVVANAGGESNSITPLRLIANHSEIMITFRRKASDCSIIASRIHLHFDDLLWVLTDSQVQSAMLCMKAMRDMMERSNQQMRKHDSQNQEANAQTQPNLAEKPKTAPEDPKEEQYASQYFHTCAILESSFHIDFDNVDLHICEETHSTPKSGLQGGAIQLSLRDLKIDHYPNHKPASDRNHFRDYGTVMRERDSWASSIIKKFRNEFAMLREAARSCGNLNASGQDKKPARLSENCISVRLADIEIHQVTMQQKKNQGSGHIIRSTRKQLHLPEEMLLFHFTHTKYYYPDGRDYPAPSDNSFMQINAPLLHAHWDTLIWLNRLATMTVNAVQKMLEDLGIVPNPDEDIANPDGTGKPREGDDSPHVDVRIQLLMPKIFIPGPETENPNHPIGLEIQASKATVTNCREGFDCHRQQLIEILDRVEEQDLAKNRDKFPGDPEMDMAHVNELLRQHGLASNSAFNVSFNEKNVFLTRKSLTGRASEDVWSVDVDNLWIDFMMKPTKEKRKERESSGFHAARERATKESYIDGENCAFVDSFPVQIWIGKSTVEGAAKIARRPKRSAGVTTRTPCNEASDEDVSSGASDSPRVRGIRNSRLRDYYKSPPAELGNSVPAEANDPADGACDDVISTCVLLHTKESLRLQVDHYQYLFLMDLPDMLEGIGKRLEESSKAPSVSAPSTCPSSPDSVSSRSRRPKRNPVEITSVRIDAPTADLFLILPKPELPTQAPPYSNGTDSVSTTSDYSPSNREAMLREMGDKIRLGLSNPPAPAMRPSPMWSETGSESVSIQGSENNVSVSGDSYANDDVGSDVTSPAKVSLQEPKTGITSPSPSNQSIVSEKSVTSDEVRATPMPDQVNHAHPPMNKDLLKIGNLHKGSSVSSSSESLPVHDSALKTTVSYQRRHSQASSICSEDQFVVVKVDRKDTNASDTGSVRFVKDETRRSDSFGDTSSISSRVLSANNATPSESECKDANDTVSIESRDAADSVSREVKSEESSSSVFNPEKTKPYSVVLLHISDGVEIATDSNDSGSSLVKMNAATVDIVELGSLDRRQTDSIFEKYSAKKVRKLWADKGRARDATECPYFSLRVDTGPLAGRFSALAAQNGFTQLVASSVPLNVKASTLSSFGDFFEEEGPSKITPMTIDVSAVKLAIEIDTATAVEPPRPPETIALLVHSASVKRTDDGNFHVNSVNFGNADKIKPPPESPPDTETNEVTSSDPISQSVSPCNGAEISVTAEEAETQTVSNDTLRDENRRMTDEMEMLRTDLRLAESENERLRSELRALREGKQPSV